MTGHREKVQLIVNADDFGRSRGINRGVIECHDHGILTSASLMTVWPASREAAELTRSRPRLSVGLHVDLGEWLYRDGEWDCTYLRVPLEDERAVHAELERQLRVFRHLMGRDPTHLDSHQHVHREEPVRTTVLELGHRLGVPVRHESHAIHYRGDFFGQTQTGETNVAALSVEALIGVFGTLDRGTTELGCHPGYADDLATAYRRERALEVMTLRDTRVRSMLESLEIALVSFSNAAPVRALARVQLEAGG
jgi:chitin disaccharide deacetylase